VTTTVVLPEVPGLGGLYLRGAGLAVARRVRSGPATLPDVSYVVRGVHASDSHLTDYQHLLGESLSDQLPAGFVHVLAFPVATALMTRSDFPLSLVGLVHVSNRVRQLRPVFLGDALDVRASAVDLRPHRSGTQVDLVTEVSVDGSPAWRGVSTYLARGVSLAGPAAPDDSPTFVPPTPTGRWTLSGDIGRRYAAVSGDRNPIHLSALSAKALGFPRAIAHGMYTASRALADVGAGRGDAFDWSVEFVKPVLLPGTVTTRIARDDDGFTFAGWDARSGKPHLTGSVRSLSLA
jgi:acyl dehydratase